jgi:Flp pilus assembly protein TadG
VEYALVLVIFLSIIFAIIDFGRALYTYHFVSNVAREATRWASVRSSTTKLPGGAATNGASGTVQQTFASSTALAGMGLDPSKITMTTSFVNSPSGAPACGGANKPGCVVQVQVTYAYNFIFPFLPAGTINMQSTSQMVITQ